MSATIHGVEVSIGCETSKLVWNIRRVSDLQDWCSRWDAVNSGAWGLPLLSTEMIGPALSRFGNGTEFVAFASRESRVVCAAILRARSKFAWEVFQPSQIPVPAIVASPVERFDAVVESLLASLPPSVIVLSIPSVDSGMFPRPSATPRIEVSLHMQTGAMVSRSGWREYFEGQSAVFRRDLGRRARRAVETQGNPNLVVLRNEPDVEGFIDLYAGTESRGWKGRAGTAVRVGEAQAEFYCEVLKSFSRLGMARMFILRFGLRPVAQQIAVESNGVLYLLKMTYDETFKSFAPGVMQRQLVLEWAARNACRIARAEIYGKITDFHKPFVNDVRDVYHATVFRARFLRVLRDGVRNVGGLWRQASVRSR